MRVKVRRLRHEGRNMHQKEVQDCPAVVGELTVAEARDPELGRQVLRARLLDINSGTEHDILPELSDARLLAAEGNKFCLTGLERIDKASYAQTWSLELS
jgi:hypothetical protein